MKKIFFCIILICSCTKTLPTKLEDKKVSDDYLGSGRIIGIIDEKYPKQGIREFKTEFQNFLNDVYPQNDRNIYPFTESSEKIFWQMWDIFFNYLDINAHLDSTAQYAQPQKISKNNPVLIYKNKIITGIAIKKQYTLKCPQTTNNTQEDPIYITINGEDTFGIVKKNLFSQSVYNSTHLGSYFHGYQVYSSGSYIVMQWIFGYDRPFYRFSTPKNRYTSIDLLYENMHPGRVYSVSVDGESKYSERLNCYDIQYYDTVNEFPY